MPNGPDDDIPLLSEEATARALAPLIEILGRDGSSRPATPNDVLEFVGTPRYVLKDAHGRYIRADGQGWTDRQREALVIPDADAARASAEYGRRNHGVRTRVVRVRRKGTCGVAGVRLRQDVVARIGPDNIELDVTPEDAMGFLAAMTGAKDDDGTH
jgi:hypothetical protein